MESLRQSARGFMEHVAGFINYWTKGKIKPSHITAVSLLGHVPVAWALVACRPVVAAILLAVFAGLDALDGALARVQHSVSRTGMFFDSVSDRVKEIVVFSALAVYVYKHVDVTQVWLVAALAGASVLVSFVRARGEASLAGTSKQPTKANTAFAIGFASYEVRVIAIIVGLLFGWITYILPLLLAATMLTAALRFIVVSRELYLLDKADEATQKEAKKQQTAKPKTPAKKKES